MLLLDIGNTTISCARSDSGKLGKIREFGHYGFEHPAMSMLGRSKDRTVLFASVVPDLSRRVRRLCRDRGCPVLECGREVNIPVVNRYRRPEEVGQDRLLNVYTVNKLYKGCDIRLVVDLGTALTFDFITTRGAYNGGLIFPGMRTALDALTARCALLPKKINSVHTRSLYAKSTGEAIINGIDYGYSFLITGMVEHLKRKDPGMKVLLTGGGGRFLIKSICKYDKYDEHLSLRGLNELARELVDGMIIPERGKR